MALQISTGVYKYPHRTEREILPVQQKQVYENAEMCIGCKIKHIQKGDFIAAGNTCLCRKEILCCPVFLNVLKVLDKFCVL